MGHIVKLTWKHWIESSVSISHGVNLLFVGIAESWINVSMISRGNLSRLRVSEVNLETLQ